MSDQDEELAFTLAKALISGGVNLAVPGLGSLLAIGANRFGGSRKEYEQAVNDELLAAVREVQPACKEGRLARTKRRLSPSRYRESKNFLKDIRGLEALRQSGESAGAPIAAEEILPADERITWSALGRKQLELAGASGFVPGCWQDEFTTVLKRTARDGLNDPSRKQQWRSLIGVKDGPDPTGAELTSWAKQVVGVFALRLEANSKLNPVIEALRESERDAVQRALLWRMDQQRRSLQVVAGAMCALLIAFGVEVDVLFN